MKEILDKLLEDYDSRKKAEAAIETKNKAANEVARARSVETLRALAKPLFEEVAKHLSMAAHVARCEDRLSSDSYPQLTLYFQPKPKVETSRKFFDTSKFSLGCFGNGEIQFVETVQQQYAPRERNERLIDSTITSEWLNVNVARFVKEVLGES